MMKNCFSKVLVLVLIVLGFCNVADARMGGGRSSGSRGSRGYAPRPMNPSPDRQRQPPPAEPYHPEDRGRSSFTRGVLGGVAGGFLGSILARNLGFGGDSWGGAGRGGGGLGLLLLAAFGFLLYRRFRGFSPQPSIRTVSPQLYRPPPSVGNEDRVSQSNFVDTLQRHDPHFDLSDFKDQRMDDFLKIQSAWSLRDLSPVQNLLDPEMRETLQTDVNELKRARQINRIENMAVRALDLIEAWQETGREYATLNIRAQLLDYTIDEVSQALVSGDRAQPVKFDEEWTFVRNLTEPNSASNPWKLSAIVNR